MSHCDTHEEPANVQITQVFPLHRDDETVRVCGTCLDNADEDVGEFFAEDVVEDAHRAEVKILPAK